MEQHQFKQNRSEIIKLKRNKKPKAKRENTKIRKLKIPTTSNLEEYGKIRLKYHNYQYGYYYYLFYKDRFPPLDSESTMKIYNLNTETNEKEKSIEKISEKLNKDYESTKHKNSYKPKKISKYSKTNLKLANMKDTVYATLICCSMKF